MENTKQKTPGIFQLNRLTQRGPMRLILMLTIVILNVGCDQVSKSWVREKVTYYERIPIIGEQMILTKVENTGAFLSLGSKLQDNLRPILLLWLPGIALITILGVVWFQKGIDPGILLGTYFMVGGGIGNLIDRWRFNSVTDFLHIDLGFAQTGIFNLADVSIMIGAGCVIVFSLIHNRKNKDSDSSDITPTAAPE